MNSNTDMQNKVPEKSSEILNKPFILLLIFTALISTCLGAFGYKHFSEKNKKGSTVQIKDKTCEYNDQTYANGASFDDIDGCNTCTCNNGKISCSLLICETPQPVVVYGDSRTGHDIHQQIVDTIITFDPAMIFHTGDLVNDGNSHEDWASFDGITEELFEITEFYPALGNHEQDSDLYYSRFELPNNEQWYSVDYNEMHFIVLDSNVDTSPESEQYLWLKNDLENTDSQIEYTVVILHHPPYSTGMHDEDEMHLRVSIVPLFEDFDVDIVFSGHDHTYERSFNEGIYYIVAGGGGAPLYDQARESPYSQKFQKTYHFCVLEIVDEDLRVQVFDLDSNVIDEFEIVVE